MAERRGNFPFDYMAWIEERLDLWDMYCPDFYIPFQVELIGDEQPKRPSTLSRWNG